MRLFSFSFLFLFINVVHACETAEIVHEEKKIKLCYNKQSEQYLSLDCKNIKNCFLKKNITFQFMPDQSPGFSLCYQLGGSPFFAEVVGKKDKVPMCFMKPYFIDQESLFLEFKKVKP